MIFQRAAITISPYVYKSGLSDRDLRGYSDLMFCPTFDFNPFQGSAHTNAPTSHFPCSNKPMRWDAEKKMTDPKLCK